MLIDLDNLLFKHIFKAINLDSESISKNIIHSIKKYVEDYEPAIVIASSDYDESEYRLELYPEYKANRRKVKYSKDDKALFRKKNDVKSEVMNSLIYLGVVCFGCQNIESDDIINYINNKYKKATKIIISSDQDYYQLLSPKTIVYDSTEREEITYKKVLKENSFLNLKDIKKYQVMYKCIKGDSSDNIPGIPGYGKVKAKELLERFFTNKLTEKDKALLIENKENLLLYKQLINLASLPEKYSEIIEKEFNKAVSIVKQNLNSNVVDELEERYNTRFHYLIRDIKHNFEESIDELPKFI